MSGTASDRSKSKPFRGEDEAFADPLRDHEYRSSISPESEEDTYFLEEDEADEVVEEEDDAKE